MQQIDIADVYGWAEEMLKRNNISHWEMSPGAYLHLLGNCYPVTKWTHELVKPALIFQIREFLMKQVQRAVENGLIGIYDCNLIVDKLILPCLRFEMANGYFTWYQIQDSVKDSFK
jgi:hypothetical protein